MNKIWSAVLTALQGSILKNTSHCQKHDFRISCASTFIILHRMLQQVCCYFVSLFCRAARSLLLPVLQGRFCSGKWFLRAASLKLGTFPEQKLQWPSSLKNRFPESENPPFSLHAFCVELLATFAKNKVRCGFLRKHHGRIYWSIAKQELNVYTTSLMAYEYSGNSLELGLQGLLCRIANKTLFQNIYHLIFPTKKSKPDRWCSLGFMTHATSAENP